MAFAELLEVIWNHRWRGRTLATSCRTSDEAQSLLVAGNSREQTVDCGIPNKITSLLALCTFSSLSSYIIRTTSLFEKSIIRFVKHPNSQLVTAIEDLLTFKAVASLSKQGGKERKDCQTSWTALTSTLSNKCMIHSTAVCARKQGPLREAIGRWILLASTRESWQVPVRSQLKLKALRGYPVCNQM